MASLEVLNSQFSQIPFTDPVYTYRSKITAAGCIILSPNREQVILVFDKRSERWSFPKGSIELGETEFEAAIRETYEEAGIQLTPDLLDDRITIRKYALYLVTLPINIEPHPIDKNEISQACWIKVSDIQKFELPIIGMIKKFFKL